MSFLFPVLFLSVGPVAQVSPAPSPPQNPFTVPKALLGKALFWDEQLSSTGMTACGTCHVLDQGGGSDPRSRTSPLASTHPGQDLTFGTADDVIGSQGVIRSNAQGNYASASLFGLDPQVTGRKAPSVINSGFPAELFWDGRAESFFPFGGDGGPVPSALESQALEPLVDPGEMGHDGIQWADLEARLPGLEPLAFAAQIPTTLANFIANQTYADLFAIVFDDATVTRQRVIMAIATYQRSLVSDEIIQRLRPLTKQESRGGSFFDSAMFCGQCHFGARFTDDQFHDIGVSQTSGDPGRGAVTGNPADLGAFRTPSLHNVELRAPYFHNGSAATLEDVVDFYHTGPGAAVFPGGVLPLQPGDKEALVAYMRTFTDPRVAAGEPPFDRPLLFSESTGVPALYGGATPRVGVSPEAIAVEPPSLANPHFTLGLRNAYGGGTALLLLGPDPHDPGVAFRGITAYVDPASFTLSPPLAISGDGAGNGYASMHLPLPSMGVGTPWYAQWLVFDPMSPPPQPPGGGATFQRGPSPRWISASEAVTFTVF